MSACYVILAHITWALAREWALFIRAAKTVTWALARDTTVHEILHWFLWVMTSRAVTLLWLATYRHKAVWM